MAKKIFSLLLFASFLAGASGQGFISGSFQSNTNFFVRDSSIGAANLPQYDNLKVGSDIWLNLNYTNEKFGLDAGVRFDAFLNSIIFNPSVPYTGVGIGNFYIRKKFGDFTISAGYLYDQIGTGMIFRAYEERTLGIDNALVGGRVEYDVKHHLHLKAFSGVQKNIFSFFNPIITGFNAESNFQIGKVTLQPSFGLVNRSMDQASMNNLVTAIEALDSSKRFTPKYNVYIFSFYNTLTAGPVSWYVEACYKTRDATYGVNNVLLNTPGNTQYTSLNLSTKGFGATFLFKRTYDFELRTSPGQTLLQGLLNFEPPVARQNSLRLPSRYFAPALDQHELAFGTELTYSPTKKLSFVFNGSYISDLIFEKNALIQEQSITTGPGGVLDTVNTAKRHFFTEANLEMRYSPSRKILLEGGFQYIFYNRVVYQGDGGNIPGEYMVSSYTPFFELTHKFTKKMSYRIELQYQYVPNDFGQWLYGLFEFNIAPSFSVAASDMWNFKPNQNNVDPLYTSQHHFYSVFASYTYGAHRFSLNYVKQVSGIVCTGGVCRYEPAFSGVKFAVTSTF